jgi:hypothetical protein
VGFAPIVGMIDDAQKPSERLGRDKDGKRYGQRRQKTETFQPVEINKH